MKIIKEENEWWAVYLDSEPSELIHHFNSCRNIFELKAEFLKLMSRRFDDATEVKFLNESVR